MQESDDEKDLRLFQAGVRKVERLLNRLAGGGDLNGNFSKETMAIFRQINALEDKSNRMAEDVRESCYVECSRLRRSVRESEQTGYAARQARRNVELQRLREQSREDAWKKDVFGDRSAALSLIGL